MKTNMSLCSLELAAGQIQAPCLVQQPRTRTHTHTHKPCSPFFHSFSTAAGLQIHSDLSNFMPSLIKFTPVNVYSFIFRSGSCHRLEGRGPKGQIGARCCYALSVSLDGDRFKDKQSNNITRKKKKKTAAIFRAAQHPSI